MLVSSHPINSGYGAVDFPDAAAIISFWLKRFRIAEVPAWFREGRHECVHVRQPPRVLYYPLKSLLASLIAILRLIRIRRREERVSLQAKLIIAAVSLFNGPFALERQVNELAWRMAIENAEMRKPDGAAPVGPAAP